MSRSLTAQYVTAAFATGYASIGPAAGPPTSHTRAACRALEQFTETNPQPGSVTQAHTQGRRAAQAAAVKRRRDNLHKQQTDAARDATRQLAEQFNPTDLTLDPQATRSSNRDTARDELHRVMRVGGLLTVFATMNRTAHAEAKAEGQAGATWLVGDAATDLPTLVTSAAGALDAWTGEDAWTEQQVNGLAGDLADAYRADPAVDLRAVVAAGNGVDFYLEQAVSDTYHQAAMSAYAAAGVDLLDYVALADACEDCQDLEGNSPYTQDSFPTLPQHGRCRCLASPVGTVSLVAA